MVKQLFYRGEVILYELLIKNQKNIVLNVNQGRIKITAPAHAQDWEIESLIYRNIKRVLKALDMHNNYQKIRFSYDNDGYVWIFNQRYRLLLVNENIHPKIINDELIVLKDYGSEAENQKKLHNFLRQKFGYYFTDLLNKWASIMQLDYKNLSIKNLTRKWGVCYPQQQKIILNIKLIHFEPQVLEYVIVHELTHLVHHNHSKAFWYYVEKYLPDYRDKIKILKYPGV